jgi:hydroxymethylpyrimidine pyrophosphatase-like HAD family hydrolase
MKNITWLFDVDGVLCDTGERATDEFRDWFINWAQDKRICLVTGSQREKTIYQVGQEIVDMAFMNFNCLGNSIWMYGKETLINQIVLHEDERKWLEDAVLNSKFSIKTGNHIELRNGSINFSTIGRNATLDQRLLYKQWELVNKERDKIVTNFVNTFNRFEAYIGGDTSIDICLSGANKSQCIDLLPDGMTDNIIFFGDRCGPGGIDKPIADRLRYARVHKVTSYKDTWAILKKHL